MKVKDAIKLLSKQDPEANLSMFFKTPDGKLTFSSDVTHISKGVVCDEHGTFVPGVLIMKEIPKN